ncbi:MAG: hypothetical protein QXM96_03100, partial [Candidatus Woesearchaeota archaeon]
MINDFKRMMSAIISSINISFSDLNKDKRSIRREYDFTMRLFMILYKRFHDKIMNADNSFSDGIKESQSDLTIISKTIDK